MKVLVINPGSTSTKIAVYEDRTALFSENIIHPGDELAACGPELTDQLPLRERVVREALAKHGIAPERLSGVVGRGGMIPELYTGAYYVNDEMKDALLHDPKVTAHASNLGAFLAEAVAAPLGIPAIIYDAVASDDMPELAKITGFAEVRRTSFCHVLNTKAVARKYAAQIGKKYEDLSLIIAHMGGGISLSAHRGGKIIDSVSDDGGPFSPERAGMTNIFYILDLCYSGRYTKQELVRKIRGNGGLKALLGTSDCREVERRIAAGDDWAALVYDALAYQIAKGVGILIPVVDCAPDAIILTGGVAHSDLLTGKVAHYLERLAPVVVFAGEYEMEALAFGLQRVLRGEETARYYRPGERAAARACG